MFKTNAQIIWDQMMRNLKEKEKNFTVAHVLDRLGRPTTTEDYEYTAKWDITPPGGNATATALIDAVNDATNPTLKTTNVETLKKIKQQIGANPPGLYTAVPNDLNGLIGLAEAYNTAELGEVNTNNATLGWNAATQRENTVLYMNKMAKKNGTMVNIASELMSLKSGDKIMITGETGNVITKKRQVWRVTGNPIKNANATTYGNIIDVPVTYAEVSLLNVPARVIDRNRNIGDGAILTVTLERFSQDEELD
jgi:hypothetical protein